MDDDSTEAQPESPPAVAEPVEPVAPATSVAVVDEPRSGVHIPTWLAGALVVVLALLIGVAGFAVGRSTSDDGGFSRPALVSNQTPGGGQMPGGGQLPGGGQMPGGPSQGGPSVGGPSQGGSQGGSQDGGSQQGGQPGSSGTDDRGPQVPSGPGSSSAPGDTGTRGS